MNWGNMRAICITNPDTDDEIIRNLKKLDILPIKGPFNNDVAKPLAGHPDLQFFILGNNLFYTSGTPKSFLKKIDSFLNPIEGTAKIKDPYPNDIAYNIALTGTHAFHNSRYTDQVIKQELQNQDINIIHVNQGYTKCSTMIIAPDTIISADSGIHSKAEINNAQSLLISPGHIELPGYMYGFIGGASGLFNEYVFFTGTIDHHPDYKKIIDFIEASGQKPVFLSSKKAADYGSLLISLP